MKSIAIGVIGFCMVSFLAFHWLTDPTLTDSDLTKFSGKVAELQEGGGRKKYLDISLSNHPHPFRSFAYPYAFDKSSLRLLRPGVSVIVGIATTEVDSPRRNLIQNQTFYKMLALDISGREALSIAPYNRSVESNRRFGPWFCLVMAGLSIFLIVLGILRHRSGQLVIKISRNKEEEVSEQDADFKA